MVIIKNREVITMEKEIQNPILDGLIELQKEVQNLSQWKQLEAVWLKEKLGMSGEEVADALNYRVQTVYLIWHRWKQEAFDSFKRSKPGGRKHSYLTEEEEKEFLKPFIRSAGEGSILVISDIKKSFEEKIGRTVAESTIYRMLARQGWRKVAPRRRHPKSDPQIQEIAKKN